MKLMWAMESLPATKSNNRNLIFSIIQILQCECKRLCRELAEASDELAF
jgi:hypothetical protein